MWRDGLTQPSNGWKNESNEVVSVEACVIISQKTTYVSYIMTESADKENKFVC